MHEPSGPSFLSEDEVVRAVCQYLETAGYEVLRRATTRDHGYDIVAHGMPGRLIIEAKGGGSSRPASARFGKAFDARQARAHVANAVLKSMRVISLGDTRAAMALPDSPHHRREVALLQAALTQVGIGVFWVDSATSAVTLDATWSL